MGENGKMREICGRNFPCSFPISINLLIILVLSLKTSHNSGNILPLSLVFAIPNNSAGTYRLALRWKAEPAAIKLRAITAGFCLCQIVGPQKYRRPITVSGFNLCNPMKVEIILRVFPSVGPRLQSIPLNKKPLNIDCKWWTLNS
jgi:hypothetical protein